MARVFLQRRGSIAAIVLLLGLLLVLVLLPSKGNFGMQAPHLPVSVKCPNASKSYEVEQSYDTTGTTASSSSPYNYENSHRQACDFEKDREGLVHVATNYDHWSPYNEKPELTQQLTKQWKNYVVGLPEYDATHVLDASKGRGIVYACGSEGFNPLLVSIRLLRLLGCKLPVEVWHFPGELNGYQMRALRTLGAMPRDVSAQDNHIALQLNESMAKPYDIKPTSIINSAFEEVLFLDADNIPIRDPTYLFERPEFKDTGAIMWADFWSIDARNPIGKCCCGNMVAAIVVTEATTSLLGMIQQGY